MSFAITLEEVPVFTLIVSPAAKVLAPTATPLTMR
jgi:hypothetical protein